MDTAYPTSAAVPALSADRVAAMQDLFTRSYYSAAGYVFESQPYVVLEDADVLDLLSGIRAEDRRHARLLADVLEGEDQVPQPGPFPYWHRDLNYLSVPCLSGFVLEALQEDVRRYDVVLATWPSEKPAARSVLEAVRREKVSQLALLRPMSAAALEREARVVKEKIDARRKARAARLAKEKAAKDAAKKKPGAAAPGAAAAAAPAAGAKLTPKERARLAVMAARGQSPGAAPAAAAAAPAVDLSSLPDPDEPGIPPKEKAKRQMMRMRAAKGGGAPAAPAAAAAAPAPAPGADLPDPDEPGIPPKEKAKRQMMRMRAAKSAAGGAGAAAAPAAPPPPPPVEDLDPDEPGISPKEKAKRTMMRMRRAKSG